MYDYVIIEAGSAGCVLANRSSAHPAVSVCVIEADPSDSFELIHTPGRVRLLLFTKKYDWAYNVKSDPSLRHGAPLVGSNINAPTLMIAEKAADMILANEAD